MEEEQNNGEEIDMNMNQFQDGEYDGEIEEQYDMNNMNYNQGDNYNNNDNIEFGYNPNLNDINELNDIGDDMNNNNNNNNNYFNNINVNGMGNNEVQEDNELEQEEGQAMEGEGE